MEDWVTLTRTNSIEAANKYAEQNGMSFFTLKNGRKQFIEISPETVLEITKRFFSTDKQGT
jgi:hypothetical protein